MPSPAPPTIRTATPQDAETLTRLINRAFEVEKSIIEGDRVNLDEVREYMTTGEFLVADEAGTIAGCVYVEPRGDRAYFGMLSVDPARQGSGFARLLVKAAEDRALDLGARYMDINVVSLRTELPPIYLRFGYTQTGTAPLTPHIVAYEPCHLIVMSKPLVIRTALLGYGLAGKTFHAPFIGKVRGMSLDVVLSSDPKKVRADLPSVTVVSDLSAVLDNPAIDLVVVATPNSTHFDFARRALEAGKHVVVDKPITVTVVEAEALIDTARRCERVLSVFQSRRWDPEFLALREVIASGRLGDVVYFESHYDRFRPQVRDRWKEQAGPGGGIWYDLGPHLVDQALQLFGTPAAIYADMGAQREGSPSVDYFHVLLRYGKLRVVLHGSNLVPDPAIRFVVHGTKSTYRTAPQPDGDYTPFYVALTACLRGEGANPVPPEQALAVMRIIEGAIASSSSSHEVLG